MEVLSAIRALHESQEQGEKLKIFDGVAFTHFSGELIKAMVADLPGSLDALASCTDAEFVSASQVFEDVARVHGLPFVVRIEELALQHPLIDVSDDLRWARDAAEA